MDAIRTLLLARTQVVVLDPDVAAGAATRPSRDGDVEKFEDELAQLGFVMSLDLAITIRRMPNQAIQELRTWMVDTLGKTLGAQRPQVPLFRGFPKATPGDPPTLFLRRVGTWLSTRADQPCPWCGEHKAVRALDPCGHLVCTTCWASGSFAGCPICHRRIAIGEPFMTGLSCPPEERVTQHDGQLRLLHLAFDLLGTARARFEALIARTTTLSAEDRAEIEAVIDTLGPKAAIWLPRKIAVRETMAIAIARLWMISPDRHAIRRATADHLRTATDVLRVALVLMGGDPGLTRPGRLGAIARPLRRIVLEALDTLAPEPLVEDIRRHPGLWKRVGERLHPYEHAKRLPNAALAFAVVRGTAVAGATFGPTLQAQVNQTASLRIEDDAVRVTSWSGVVEDGLRSGDARAVCERLATRPGELLRRADHLLRVAQARQPDAVGTVLRTIQYAMTRAAPATLLTLGSHVARRTAPWPRRVFQRRGPTLRAWGAPDRRAPLRPEAIASIVDAVRAELVVRAEARRHYARAVIDRGLADLLVPLDPRLPSVSTAVRPRARELARPTVWDVASIHAIARANLVYIRERSGSITQYRRRDGESTVTRLSRLATAAGDDGTLSAIPPADAPTWFAVLRDDLVLPKGSAGFAFERGQPTTDGVSYLAAADLVTELVAKP
ncbi:MAG: hypothetical protein IPQ07_19655 [Myxococcales bacterium]|nr:hypothetical protein [Myxococcales bacterium]